MIKNRRVGTLTAGVSMVFFGVLFLLRLAVPAVTIRLITSLWPLILVFLGIETLLAYAMNREEKMRYDAGSVFIIMILAFFTVFMAAAQLAAENCNYLRWP
ncbi:LiaF transmembrane domain-containing protein [Caproicibacter sp.]|uniref:LiaF transmembrane domain-containing protein n=1 Tax=Caproicibacter sp. TaxID=2814884 RepID=UPI00398931D7